MSEQNEILSSTLDEHSEDDAVKDAGRSQKEVFDAFFDQLVTSASRNISEKFNAIANKKSYERGNNVMEQTLGLSYNFVYYIRSFRRTFPLDRLWAFCEYFAHMSCHELTLGEEKPVILPKIPAYIATCLSTQGYMHGLVGSLIKTYKPKIRRLERTPARPEVCLERIRELADDLQMPIKRAQAFVWSKNDSSRILFDSQQRVSLFRRIETKNNTYVKLSSAIMLTFLLDMPLDFFICEDYTTTCKIAVKDQEGKTTVIDDPDIIRLISIYLSLSDSDKDRLFADVALRDAMFKTMFASITSL